MKYIIQEKTLTIKSCGKIYRKVYRSSQKLNRDIKKFHKEGLAYWCGVIAKNDELFVEGIDTPIPSGFYFISDVSDREFQCFKEFWKKFHTLTVEKEKDDFIKFLNSINTFSYFKSFDTKKLLRDLEELRKKPTLIKRMNYLLKYPRKLTDDILSMNINSFYEMEISSLKQEELSNIQLAEGKLPACIEDEFVGTKIKKVFCIDDNFKKLAFHGTKNISVIPIINKGLKIFPEDSHSYTGKAYGEGLYFTNSLNKAKNFSQGVILIFDLHLENTMVHVGRAGSDTKLLEEYDSIYVPGGNGMNYDEIVVFDESKAKLKYIVWYEK